MKTYSLLFLILLISCSDKKEEQIKKASAFDLTTADMNARNNTNIRKVIYRFSENLKSDNIESNKSLIDSFPAFSNNHLLDNLFTQSMWSKNNELIHYFLSKGYQPINDHVNTLAKSYTSDTTLFQVELFKKIKEKDQFYFHALSDCNLEQFEFLLDNTQNEFDFDVSYMPHNEKINLACLSRSCTSKMIEILALLNSKGFKIHEQHYDCLLESPFEGIPDFLSIELIKKLIDNGAFLESKTWSPLNGVATWNENNLLEFFLKEGYNPNRNSCSEILFLAATRPGDGFGEHILPKQNLDAIKLLLTYGANPDLPLCFEIEDNPNLTFRDFIKTNTSTLNSDILQLME